MVGGARLTGRAGRFSIGALNIQTDDKPSARAVATNFTARPAQAQHPPAQQRRRDGDAPRARRRSAGDASYTVGADATLLFFKSINVTSYYARTSTPGAARRHARAIAAASTTPTIATALAAEHMLIGARLQAGGRLRPAHRFPPQLRPGALQPAAEDAARCIRKLTWQGEPRLRHRRAAARRCRTARRAALFRIDFQIERPADRSSTSRELRAAAGAVSRFRPASSCRRAATTYDDQPRQLQSRPAAEGVGPAVGGGRHALRRDEDRGHLQRPRRASCRSSRSSRA